jgi:anaerobic C4-dicarboxylate transporter
MVLLLAILWPGLAHLYVGFRLKGYLLMILSGLGMAAMIALAQSAQGENTWRFTVVMWPPLYLIAALDPLLEAIRINREIDRAQRQARKAQWRS